MEKGKVQGAVKVAEGKHRPANGPISRGIFFSSPVSSGAYLNPQTDPYSGEFPFAGIYRRTKGDPRFFCGKTTVCFLRKMCPCRKGEQEASLWPGEGRALKDIWHSCGKRFGSRGGRARRRMQPVSFFRSPMDLWRPKAKPGGSKTSAKFPGSRGLGLGSGQPQVARTEIVPASVPASFQPGKTRKGQNPENRRRGQPGTGKRKSAAPGTGGQTLRYFKYRSYQVSTKSGAKGPFFWRIQ